MRAIHQLVAGFSNGDAISNEARVLRGCFRSWGAASEIYCEQKRILPELRRECHDLAQAAAEIGPDDVVLLHLSIGSDANRIFPDLQGRKAILYHNITPPEYFRGLHDQTASLLALGREQAAGLKDAASVVLADSGYNAQELVTWGYRDPKVFPLALDFDSVIGARPDRGFLKKYGDGLVNILFVGRCAPNKRIEDDLAAFHYFQKYVEPNSRFIHAGSYAGMERYHALLLTAARDWQLNNAELLGTVRQGELSALYQTAHVFLCLSEHEGFCIPLLEAMHHGVPVVAHAAAAVPETLDGAGVLVTEKNFALIAETMGRLVRDADLRRRVIEKQRARIDAYRNLKHDAMIREHLTPLLG